MKSIKVLTTAACCTLFGFSGSSASADGHAPETPATYTGYIADAAGYVPRKSTAHFTLKIERWTSDEEVAELLRILDQQGPAELADVMNERDVGFVKIGDRLGYHIAVARTFETDQGRIVRAATDRPIQMWEVRRGTRSEDYAFGIIEILLDANGKGEGQLIAAAEIELEDATLNVETFGVKPFKLLKMQHREKKKKK